MDVHGGSVPANNELPGVPFERSEDRQILQRIRELCGWKSKGFPGAQPVSLSFANIDEMARNSYVACEKTDGVRLLLFATETCVFLVDRLEKIRALQYLHMPQEFDEKQRQHITLMDGELVKDIEEDGTVHMRFLVFDAMAIQGDVQVKKSNLIMRLKRAYVEVIKPRTDYLEKHPEQKALEIEHSSYLDIYLKDFFEVWDSGDVVKFGENLPHESDGIIFTPVAIPYVAGTCKELLKWKPPHLNTVDFAATVVFDSEGVLGVVLGVGDRGMLTWSHYEGMCLVPEGPIYEQIVNDANQMRAKTAKWGPNMNSFSKSFVECSFSPDKESLYVAPVPDKDYFEKSSTRMGGWVALRFREDKDRPNDKRVVEKVKQSIEDGITLEKLLEKFEAFKEHKKPVLENIIITKEKEDEDIS